MKRTLDIVASSALLLLLMPVCFVLVGIIFWRLGTPVFFTQLRPGLQGKPFRLIKFRTMTDARDFHGKLLPDALRLTALGRFLRATSLDEIPGLWNVLKGEMSLVGPRPLLMEYLDLYSEEQARRHEAKPGVTGWAQVNGRNALGWEEKFKLDVWYVENQSLRLDLKILLLTVKVAFLGRGVRAPGEETAAKFSGNREDGSCL